MDLEAVGVEARPDFRRLQACATLDWREEANLGAGAARLIAERLREEAARYEAGE